MSRNSGTLGHKEGTQICDGGTGTTFCETSGIQVTTSHSWYLKAHQSSTNSYLYLSILSLSLFPLPLYSEPSTWLIQEWFLYRILLSFRGYNGNAMLPEQTEEALFCGYTETQTKLRRALPQEFCYSTTTKKLGVYFSLRPGLLLLQLS